MERFKNGAPPTMLVEYDYGYDAVGNRLYTRDLMATDRSELYGYDARNRLRNFGRGTLNAEGTAITTPLVDPVLPSQQQWTDLDRRGNWLDFSTTLNGQPAVQQTRETNQVNEITTLDPDGPGGGQSPYTLANDNNGNLTENPWAFNAGDGSTPTGQKYEYDEENRLVRVKRLTSPADQVLLEIGYDAFGRRVESREYLDAQTKQMLTTARVTHHVVLGPMTIEEYTITAGPTALLAREFVWGTEFPMPIAMIDRTGSQAVVLHYLRDVLGNVVALTDAKGDVVERYRYDPYGMTHIYTGGGALLPASAYGNPYAYTTQRYDAAVALYHFWYRTYSPSLGRWHQRDPIGYADGVSLYEYVTSSPLNWTDPLGLLAGDATEDDVEIPNYWPEGLSSESPKGCAGLLASILGLAKNLAIEIANYDPAQDRGGKPYNNKGGRTKPGGHRRKLESKRRQLKNLIDEYNRKCPPAGYAPLPEKVNDVVNMPIPQSVPVPVPVKPFSRSLKQTAVKAAEAFKDAAPEIAAASAVAAGLILSLVTGACHG